MPAKETPGRPPLPVTAGIVTDFDDALTEAAEAPTGLVVDTPA